MKQKSDFFKVNVVYLITLIIFVLVRIVANANIFAFLGEFQSYFLNLVIQIGAMFCIPVFLFTVLKKQKIKETFKNYNYKKVSFKAIILSIVSGICVFLLNLVVATIFSSILQSFGYEPSTSTVKYESYSFWFFLLSLFFTAVLPGICEETAHRGMLLYGYKKLGVKKAILLSALMFGLMHLNIEQFFYATIIGLLLGYLTINTGSIIPAMIIHFINNGISVYITYASYNNLWLGNFFTRIGELLQSNFVVAFFTIFVVLIICAGLLIYCVLKLINETKVKYYKNLSTSIAKKQLRNDLLMGIDGFKPEIDEGTKIIISPLPNSTTGFSVQMELENDEMFYPPKQVEKVAFKENIFFIANIFLTVVVTICTFIWGVI